MRNKILVFGTNIIELGNKGNSRNMEDIKKGERPPNNHRNFIYTLYDRRAPVWVLF